MAKEIIKQVFDLYESNYQYKNEAAAFCFWYIIINEKKDSEYLYTFLNLLMTSATNNTRYFSVDDFQEIVNAQAKDPKELRRIWRNILFDLSIFEYDSFQAIISVDELLDSLDIESVWHFDVPLELFGKYKHILDIKGIDTHPPSRNDVIY